MRRVGKVGCRGRFGTLSSTCTTIVMVYAGVNIDCRLSVDMVCILHSMDVDVLHKTVEFPPRLRCKLGLISSSRAAFLILRDKVLEDNNLTLPANSQ